MQYMTGYNGTTRTRDELLLAWSQWQNLDYEMQRRTLAILDASYRAGTPLGIGEIFRLTSSQTQVFLSRHIVVSSGGCCSYNGKRYKLLPGMAHVAPPGQSYHEATTPTKKALAIDFTGNLKFLAAHGKEYGIDDFADTGNEPWHGQPNDVPSGPKNYVVATHHPLKVIALPGPPPPKPLAPEAPTPLLRTGVLTNSLEEVRQLQHLLNWLGFRDAMGRNLIVDGDFGAKTAQAVIAMQVFFRDNFDPSCAVDGVYGPQTAKLLQNFLNGLAALAPG